MRVRSEDDALPACYGWKWASIIVNFALAGDCYVVGTALAMVNDRVREDGSMVPRKRLEDHVIYQPSTGYSPHLQCL